MEIFRSYGNFIDAQQMSSEQMTFESSQMNKSFGRFLRPSTSQLKISIFIVIRARFPLNGNSDKYKSGSDRKRSTCKPMWEWLIAPR